jgi:hypothetical protein
MAFSKTLNDQIWKDIVKRDSKKQRELLEWQLQAREPIVKFSDMKVGDHLIKKKSVGGMVLYYHHFLCIGSEGDGWPTIIHYFNTATNAARQFLNTFGFGSGSALGQLGIVQEVTLPHKDFIESESELQEKGAEVERVVWPDELRRYPIEEVMEIIYLKCVFSMNTIQLFKAALNLHTNESGFPHFRSKKCNKIL